MELLTDMLENRMSDMCVTDREDAKELFLMKRALQELAAVSMAQAKPARRRAAPVRRAPALLTPATASDAVPQLSW